MPNSNFSRQRLTFPLFNTLVCAIFSALVGYYIFRPWLAALIGALAGLLLALLLEYALPFGSWIYRRRVLLLTLLELPFFVLVAGPYAFVLEATRPNPQEICCQTPLDYGAETFEDVRIPGAGGVTLAGWYVPPAATTGPVVIVLHGSESDRRASLEHARPLIQAGYGVLLYDQRASGESSGEMTSMGWLDGPDLLAALEWVKQRPEVDAQRIGALGLSSGAHIALNAAYLEPGAFASLWLDGMQAQGIQDFPPAQDIGGQFAAFINGLILNYAELRIGRPAPPPFVHMFAVLQSPPIMLVAGGQEPFESQVNRQYAAVAGDNTELWLIEAAWHLGGLAVEPEEYTRRMLEFFDLSMCTSLGCR